MRVAALWLAGDARPRARQGRRSSPAATPTACSCRRCDARCSSDAAGGRPALAVVAAAGACTSRRTVGQPTLSVVDQTIEIVRRDKVDILFMLDNSPSVPEKVPLVAEFPELVARIDALATRGRAGVIPHRRHRLRHGRRAEQRRLQARRRRRPAADRAQPRTARFRRPTAPAFAARGLHRVRLGDRRQQHRQPRRAERLRLHRRRRRHGLRLRGAARGHLPGAAARR